MYVENSWINPGVIEKRDYQDHIVETAASRNTLCVLPTGLGKTNVAALVAVRRLEKYNGCKILFLAPTRPLVNQHKNTFEKILKLGLELRMITGEDKPEERGKLYKEADIVFSTPQTVRNDLKHGIINMKDFYLCIFDEAHRCIGNYAYTQIANRYISGSEKPLILALTASPGSQRYKIEEVKKKLFIDNVEIKTREDEDVKPYVQKLESTWAEVELTDEMKKIRYLLDAVKNNSINKLLNWKIIASPHTSKSQLIRLQETLAQKKKGYAYNAISVIAEIIKLDHALLLLETQSMHSLKSYIDKIKEDQTRAAARLMNDSNFLSAVKLAEDIYSRGEEHPKVLKLKEIVEKEIDANKDTRIIVFAQYRSTIEKIYDVLKDIKNAGPVEFIGQAKKHGKGLSQKEQNQILNEFRMGFYNVLCASQVAEEGLDVVETDMVIFYEPVPSAVRKIQRTGRTARTRMGKVIVLVTKGTRDEAFRWSAHHKEKNMEKILQDMKGGWTWQK